MKSFVNSSLNHGDNETRTWRPLRWPSGSRTRRFEEATILIPSVEPTLAYQVSNSFALPKLPIQDVFEAIKGQPWVRRLKAKTLDHVRPGVRDYCSFHDNKGHWTSKYQSLRKYFEDLVQQDYVREDILVSGVSSKIER